MQFILLILSLLINFTLGLEDNGRTHWAVLVAGSNGWSNYRHQVSSFIAYADSEYTTKYSRFVLCPQADVCHAYHVLRKNGMPPENIITMIYDDIVNHKNNPFPGKLFNDYQHKDVYAGVKINYRGEELFLIVIMIMNKEVKNATLTGCVKLPIFPSRYTVDRRTTCLFTTVITGPQPVNFSEGTAVCKTIEQNAGQIVQRKAVQKMVIYIEACNRSMFRWILPKNIDIWAVTAANPTESSWATFCEDPAITTCLSDEFSYQWMSDTEKASKVSFLPVGEFQANSTHVGSSGFNGDSSMATRDRSMASHAHLIPLMHQLRRSKSPKQMELAQRRLHRTLKLGQMVKETVDEIVEEVTSKSAPSGKPSDVHEHLDCYQNVYDQYKIKCFSIQQVPEVAKELAKLDRLCEQGYDTNVILQAIFSTCD
ncbi:Legumain-1 [Fasciola gigantica]|nr:Legumain-1 [Fasciola gigantica]